MLTYKYKRPLNPWPAALNTSYLFDQFTSRQGAAWWHLQGALPPSRSSFPHSWRHWNTSIWQQEFLSAARKLQAAWPTYWPAIPSANRKTDRQTDRSNSTHSCKQLVNFQRASFVFNLLVESELVKNASGTRCTFSGSAVDDDRRAAIRRTVEPVPGFELRAWKFHRILNVIDCIAAI